MAIMLELKPDVEARLLSQAEADGLPVNDYVEKLVQEHAGTSAPKSEDTGRNPATSAGTCEAVA